MYNDRPNIRYISVIYNVYLVPDGNFAEKYLKCGLGAIDEDEVIFKSTISRIDKNSGSNKIINVAFDE